MKIITRDLMRWIKTGLSIRYRGELYGVWYDGRKYFLAPIGGGTIIELYKTGRGTWGLETNRKA